MENNLPNTNKDFRQLFGGVVNICKAILNSAKHLVEKQHGFLVIASVLGCILASGMGIVFIIAGNDAAGLTLAALGFGVLFYSLYLYSKTKLSDDPNGTMGSKKFIKYMKEVEVGEEIIVKSDDKTIEQIFVLEKNKVAEVYMQKRFLIEKRKQIDEEISRLELKISELELMIEASLIMISQIENVHKKAYFNYNTFNDIIIEVIICETRFLRINEVIDGFENEKLLKSKDLLNNKKLLESLVLLKNNKIREKLKQINNYSLSKFGEIKEIPLNNCELRDYQSLYGLNEWFREDKDNPIIIENNSDLCISNKIRQLELPKYLLN